jgi:hypothetical protein
MTISSLPNVVDHESLRYSNHILSHFSF